jgi:hypothetical protein
VNDESPTDSDSTNPASPPATPEGAWGLGPLPLGEHLVLEWNIGDSTPAGPDVRVTLHIPATEFQRVYDEILKIGPDGLRLVLNFFGFIYTQIAKNSEQPNKDYETFLSMVLDDFQYPSVPAEKEEHVLAFTYNLLRSRVIPPALAAQYASTALGTPFTPAAWRKRLYRWIDRNKLEPIELRKGRKQASLRRPDTRQSRD